MTHEQAYILLTKYLKNKNLIKHCRSCEVAMQALCKHLHPDATEEEIQTWGITGLLHDVDYEIAQEKNMLDKHGLLIFDKTLIGIEETTFPERIKHAIQAHNYEHTQVMPASDLDWGIACIDQLTGLIIAAALVRPDKQLSSVDTTTVLKRFKEKSFAKGASRESIQNCEEKLGIPLDQFITITLQAMQEIHQELGL